jgi:hypothetical protein
MLRSDKLRADGRYRHSAADINTITPVVGFRGNCGIKISHDDVVAQRSDYTRAMHRCDPRQSTDVEMVIVAVRYQYDINRR